MNQEKSEYLRSFVLSVATPSLRLDEWIDPLAIRRKQQLRQARQQMGSRASSE
jgi:hypothetical protein